jgi:hypothetical protein
MSCCNPFSSLRTSNSSRFFFFNLFFEKENFNNNNKKIQKVEVNGGTKEKENLPLGVNGQFT